MWLCLEKLRAQERRREMLQLYVEGYMFSDFVDQVAEKYQVSVSCLRRDWGRRKKWLPQIVEVQDRELHVSMIMLRFRAVSNAAWTAFRMARKAGNLNAMNGAVGALTRLLKSEVDMLQSLGVLHAEPSRIDAVITRPPPTQWDLDPDMQRAVQRLKARLRQEQESQEKQALAGAS